MTVVLSLIFEWTVPLFAGLFVVRYLKNVLWRVLVDLCGTSERAEFWVRISAVLIAATPLLFVLATSINPVACSTGDLICSIGLLRRTCIFTLLGMLAAVGGVAVIVGRYIPREARAARAGSSTARAA
ncbi:hypothetical protein [Burkholderia sp. Ax-1724]|uniref:hypothetical protein n=1 Tax=Burkholderia sp. Ax-1724 TaxID=2608336 RepID=UPI00141E5B81|nr:hypothetical protein [Burkholderia sp. Ax-1724]NIF55093.1 hypothetical protein [Burkholderia sp. Ax-1724]